MWNTLLPMLVLGSVNSSDMQKVVSAVITWANFRLYACRRSSSDFFLAEQAVHNCHTCVFGMRIKQKWSTLSGLNKQTSAPLQNAGCTMEPINLSLDYTLRKSVKYTCFLCYFRSKPKTRLLQNYTLFACLLRFVKRCSARKNWFKWGKKCIYEIMSSIHLLLSCHKPSPGSSAQYHRAKTWEDLAKV